MSIRLLAKDLYRLHREVERLKKQLQQAPPHKKAMLEESLRRARAEKEELRRILDGQLDRQSGS